MKSRTERFFDKFTDAAQKLGSNSIQHVVSIKYRENVGHSDYERLIDGLRQHDMHLDVEQIRGDFQGNAWLVKTKNRSTLILVEHETGVEILSTAADIVSLVAVIPMIVYGWKYLRNKFAGRRFIQDKITNIEIMTINSKGQLIEEHILSVDDYMLEEGLKDKEIASLRDKVEQLEKEISEIKDNKKSKIRKLKSSVKKQTK